MTMIKEMLVIPETSAAASIHNTCEVNVDFPGLMDFDDFGAGIEYDCNLYLIIFKLCCES